MKIMKKQSIYALMSAIALSGAVGLSACSSSKDDVGEVNPNFNPNTNEALGEFVFNVAPGANHASTRQTADATQAYALDAMTTDKFRGIEDAHVMCFTGGTDGTYLTAETSAAKDFDMARVAASNSLGNGVNESTTRVLEMSLPINTNKMVFYGRAITILSIGEKSTKLTTKESELLGLLCAHQNEILQRDFALKSIWIDDNYFNARSMDVYITKLRKHLKDDDSVEIINIHGKGYKLIAPEAE